MKMFNCTWQNVGGMCHPGAWGTSLCKDCENSSSHFCCRAIMEHKELLKVPWDWQIGEHGFQTQTHTSLESYTQMVLSQNAIFWRLKQCTTCLIMCRFPLCSKNSSDLWRHGLKTSGGVLWCLAPRPLLLIHWVLYVWGWGWIGLVPAHPIGDQVWLGPREFGGQVNTLSSFLCFLWCARALCPVASMWIPGPKVSQQNIALYRDDHRQLSVVSVLRGVNAMWNHLLPLCFRRSFLCWFQCLHVQPLQLHASGDEENKCHLSQSVSAHSWPVQPLLWPLPLSLRGSITLAGSLPL